MTSCIHKSNNTTYSILILYMFTEESVPIYLCSGSLSAAVHVWMPFPDRVSLSLTLVRQIERLPSRSRLCVLFHWQFFCAIKKDHVRNRLPTRQPLCSHRNFCCCTALWCIDVKPPLCISIRRTLWKFGLGGRRRRQLAEFESHDEDREVLYCMCARDAVVQSTSASHISPTAHLPSTKHWWTTLSPDLAITPLGVQFLPFRKVKHCQRKMPFGIGRDEITFSSGG